MEHGLKVLARYRFQSRKTTVGWVHRATWRKRVRLKIIAPLQNCKWNKKNVVVLKCKKSWENSFLRKLTEMSNLILCFREITKVFICFCLREVGSFIWGLKKVDLLEKYGFHLGSISPWPYKCVKGKHIWNRRDQTCLSLSTRSPR